MSVKHHAAAGEDLRRRGCAQVIFLPSDEICETSYRDRGGKYSAAHLTHN